LTSESRSLSAVTESQQETAMTDAELRVLAEFLASGVLAGVVASWLDGLVAFVRGRG